MSGKVENSSPLESDLNRAEGSCFPFEQPRIMKVAGDGVRFRGYIRKRNQFVRRG